MRNLIYVILVSILVFFGCNNQDDKNCSNQRMEVTATAYNSLAYQTSSNPHITAFGDINMANTVLRNLINNAIKFTPYGGNVTVKSKITSLNHKEYIQISVTDTGIGISKKDKNKLLAKVDENGSLNIDAGLGKRFVFGEDNTNTFAKFGLNSFFQLNHGARDIQLNQELIEDEIPE